MKNLFQKEFLNSLLDNHEFAYNKYRREELISNFSRLKNNVPFSPRLNEWLTGFYEKNREVFVFTDFDDFDSSNIKQTLQNHIKRFKDTGKTHVWTGKSDNTIFGSARQNHFFRAWHEYVHITKALNFDFVGESIVCTLQCSMLPVDWVLERELITIEILGQNQYFSRHQQFLANQRKFAIDYMRNSAEAIFIKQ